MTEERHPERDYSAQRKGLGNGNDEEPADVHEGPTVSKVVGRPVVSGVRVNDVGPNTCDDHKWHNNGKQQAAKDTVTQSNLDRSNASSTPREDKETNEKQSSTRTHEIGHIHCGHKIDVWHLGLASLVQLGYDPLTATALVHTAVAMEPRVWPRGTQSQVGGHRK